MSKVLFPLALANLRKNYRLYGPFALAFVTSVALLYNFITLAFNPSRSGSGHDYPSHYRGRYYLVC